MNFYIIWLILLLCVVDALKLVDCFKCDFVSDKNGYTCSIIQGSVRVSEQHDNGNNDDDVKHYKYEGNSSTNFTHHELSSICQRFKNLEYVELQSVKSVDDDLFQQCKNLKIVNIIDSEVEEIPENLFSNNLDLTLIDLGNNKLNSLPENVFSNQKKLERLRLHENHISFLPPNIFQPLTKLEILNLHENKIQSLNPKWFESLQSLKWLWLYNNKIQDLPKNTFVHLRNLRKVSLSGNQLTTIHADSFGIHSKLREIYLKNNNIKAIDAKFIDNSGVEYLDMRGNVCINKEIREKNEIKVKAELRNCFSNYRPRNDQDAAARNTKLTSPSEKKCGTRNFVKQLIYHGTATRRGEYPWNVALITRSGALFCGGSLVSHRHIVTAAHCIRGKHDSHVFGPGDFLVQLGVHNHSKPQEVGRILVKVAHINVNPDWNTDVNSYDGDIAVLELTIDVKFNNHIWPICLPTENSEIANALTGIVVGFGQNENETLTDIANKLEVPIRPYHKCTSYSRHHHSYISFRTFCGGPADGRGVCSGDSGAGVYVLQNGQFYLRGLVSASLMNDLNQCDVHKEAIFTDVTKYYDWIKNYVNSIPAESSDQPGNVQMSTHIPESTTTTTSRISRPASLAFFSNKPIWN